MKFNRITYWIELKVKISILASISFWSLIFLCNELPLKEWTRCVSKIEVLEEKQFFVYKWSHKSLSIQNLALPRILIQSLTSKAIPSNIPKFMINFQKLARNEIRHLFMFKYFRILELYGKFSFSLINYLDKIEWNFFYYRNNLHWHSI